MDNPPCVVACVASKHIAQQQQQHSMQTCELLRVVLLLQLHERLCCLSDVKYCTCANKWGVGEGLGCLAGIMKQAYCCGAQQCACTLACRELHTLAAHMAAVSCLQVLLGRLTVRNCVQQNSLLSLSCGQLGSCWSGILMHGGANAIMPCHPMHLLVDACFENGG